MFPIFCLSSLSDFLVVDQKAGQRMTLTIFQLYARYSTSHFIGII